MSSDTSTEALIALLTDGEVEAFNAQRPSGKLDLYAADLGGVQAPGADLSGANLENADLSGAVLSDAMFARTDLSGTDCTGAKLDGIMGLKSKWRGAYVGEADLSSADLTAAEMQDVEMPQVVATGIVLTGAKLNGADLSDADLSEAELTEGRLNGANLTGANLSGATLTEASLIEADLTRAKLVGADLSQARLSSAKLNQADLGQAVLRNADLTGADLRGARLVGTDLRRADLTDAQLEGVDLSSADLTDAQLDPEVAAAIGRKPSLADMPDEIQAEDPSFAINDDRVAMLWENEEDGGNVVRVIVGPMRGKRPKKAAGLPIPPDLTLSKAIVPHGDGFVVLALVERPAGTTAVVCSVDKEGLPGVTRTFRVPFTPSVRPVLRVEAGEIRIYAISREGPGVHVMRIGAEGLELVHSERMSTARGFVSTKDPVVLSKGGVLVSMTAKGPGRPISAPQGFPGRSPAAAPVEGGGLALAWADRGKPGFYFTVARPAAPADARRLQPDDLAGTIDLMTDGEAVMAAWTQEPLVPGEPASAWVARLPEDKPRKVEIDDEADIAEVRFAVGRFGKNDEPCVALSPGDGTWMLATIGRTGSPKIRWNSTRS